jgi:hypothetical protein
MKMQAGSGVLHKPTQEEWFVLGVNYETGKLCVGGWPPTIANIDDCELLNEPSRELREDEIKYRNKTFGVGWK